MSQDAIVQNNPQDHSGEKTQGAENGSSEPKGQELTYAARVSLDRKQMDIDGKSVNVPYGRDGGNQNRLAHDHELFAVTVAPLQAR